MDIKSITLEDSTPKFISDVLWQYFKPLFDGYDISLTKTEVQAVPTTAQFRPEEWLSFQITIYDDSGVAIYNDKINGLKKACVWSFAEALEVKVLRQLVKRMRAAHKRFGKAC